MWLLCILGGVSVVAVFFVGGVSVVVFSGFVCVVVMCCEWLVSVF